MGGITDLCSEFGMWWTAAAVAGVVGNRADAGFTALLDRRFGTSAPSIDEFRSWADTLSDDLADELETRLRGIEVAYPFDPFILRPPSSTWSAADLLAGDQQLIPFVDWAEHRPRLEEWCTDFTIAGVAVAVVQGAGGTGKTRLCNEVAYRLRQHGWVTGALSRHRLTDQRLTNLAALQVPRLVVADYADARPSDIAELIAAAGEYHQKRSAPLRIVLVIRRRDHSTSAARLFADRAVQALIRDGLHLRLSEPTTGASTGFDIERRDALYRTVGTVLSNRHTPPEPDEITAPDLSDPVWNTPLMVAARALIDHDDRHDAAAAHALGSADAVLDALLDREQRIWATDPTRPDLPAPLLARAVAAATLLAPRTEATAIDALASAPIDDHRQATAVWLADLHHGPRPYINPLVPDRLGERLVDQHTTPELIESTLDIDHLTADPYPLIVIARAIGTSHRLSTLVEPRLVQLLGQLRVAFDTCDAPTAWELATAASRLVDHYQPPVDDLPEITWTNVGAVPLAVSLQERLVAHERSDVIRRRRLAESLHNLAKWLTAAGRRGEAVTASTESADIFRELAEIDPVNHAPNLAMSLNNRSVHLGDVGLWEEALAAATEAVEMYRELVDVDLGTYVNDLAMSLNNLSVWLADAGRRDEGLVAITEAVDMCRDLAKVDFPNAASGLARSLNNLSLRLAEVGRRDDALAATTEAVDMYRELSESDPSFGALLALSLHNQAAHLSEVGRRDDALAASTESVDLWRSLADLNMDAHGPDLAMSLNNHSVHLSLTGRYDEALSAITEATSIYRALAAHNMSAHGADLALSLNNQSSRLAEAGRAAEGLIATTEAVDIYRALAEINMAAHGSYLAGSLNNLSVDLHEAGRHEEAVETVTEATEIYRALVAINPAAHRPDLAMSLNNQSGYLASLGHDAEALMAIIDAVAMRRELAAANPVVFGPDLAGSLHNLSDQLTTAGRHEEALAAATESVDTRRRLADLNMGVHGPDLARSLSTLARALRSLDRDDEAERIDAERASILEQLDDQDPPIT